MDGQFPAELYDDYCFQMGVPRARLALSVDLLTDAIVRLGRHRMYDHTPDGRPRPNRDIEASLAELEHVRRLLVEALRESAADARK